MTESMEALTKRVDDLEHKAISLYRHTSNFEDIEKKINEIINVVNFLARRDRVLGNAEYMIDKIEH